MGVTTEAVLRVGDVMTPGAVTIAPHSTLQEAASLMQNQNIGSLVVCEVGRVVGMITDRDITTRSVALGHDAFGDRVREIMSAEVVCGFAWQDVRDAVHMMAEHKLRRLPVLNDDGHLVGMLSVDDLATRSDCAELVAEILRGTASE